MRLILIDAPTCFPRGRWPPLRLPRSCPQACGLYVRAWNIASQAAPKNEEIGTDDSKSVGTTIAPIGVNWRESHLREIVSTIPAQDLASTNNSGLVDSTESDLVESNSTKVEWHEFADFVS